MLLHVKLTPNAKADKIDGKYIDENGQEYLKVYTTVVPENGKANKQLIKMIAKKYKIPKSSIELIKGQKSKLKVLEFYSQK